MLPTSQSYISAIWWPEHQHAEIEIKGIQYSIFHGTVTKVPAFIRESRAAAIPHKCFYRFSLKINEEALQVLHKELESDNLKIIPEHCCGSVAMILNQYTDYNITFWESRSPLLLGLALFDKAEAIQFIGQKKLEKSKNDLNTWHSYYKEVIPTIHVMGCLILVGVVLYCKS